MKIVKASEMGRVEKLSIAAGASEMDFMERAAEGVVALIQKVIAACHLKPKITLLCGPGNNGGDAFTAGRLLLGGDFHVHALLFAPPEKCTPLCRLQSRRFVEAGGMIEYVRAGGTLSFCEANLLVDGLLGTGFHGEVQGLLKKGIEAANASGLPIISIDIPSGINGTTGEIGGVCIHASHTLFLELPKKGCFFQEPWNFTGRIHIHPFGLERQYLDQAEADYLLIDPPLIKQWMPKIERTRQKYQAGYVVGVGGSKGMPGAPLMASFASLRAGAGIVRLLHPEGMEGDAAPLEVILQAYQEGDISLILESAKKASALFIGPGLGTSSQALQMLQALFPHLQTPCVIDAEALTLLGANPIPFPENTILTPHHGEMHKLLQSREKLPFPTLLKRSQDFASHHGVTLVLKGSPTFIFHPDTKPYVCPRGDPGMATAGSGDVLTGVIAALLAQTHHPLQAAILGIYLHAVAGEYAASQKTSYCMVATDITAALPLAFKEFGQPRQSL